MRVMVLFLVATTTSSASADGEECGTMQEFMQEVVTPEPTARARHFAWTCGFRFSREHLFRAFSREARRAGFEPLGVLSIGPVGALYAHHTVAILQTPKAIRVVYTVVAHNRFVYKSTALVSDRSYRQYRGRLRHFGYLKPAPSSHAKDEFVSTIWKDLSFAAPTYRIGREREGGDLWESAYNDVFAAAIGTFANRLEETFPRVNRSND